MRWSGGGGGYRALTTYMNEIPVNGVDICIAVVKLSQQLRGKNMERRLTWLVKQILTGSKGSLKPS
jgi:hypothetical protein